MRLSRLALLVLATLVVTGCAREPRADDPSVRGIGYVRIDDIVKKHPLYPQLSQIQDAIDALDLKSLGPGAIPRTSAQIAQQTKELNNELIQAQNRATQILQQKRADYGRREQEAVSAALRSAGAGTNGNTQVTQMQGTAAQQAQAVTSQARADFEAYQRSVIAQDTAAVAQIGKQLGGRAEQSYRQKATELQERESALGLQLSQQDAPRRLQLQTKLNNLALDDATRKQYRNQLAAIDQNEAEVVGAQRTRDQQELAAYQKQLGKTTQTAIAAQVTKIHNETRAKLSARQNEVAQQVSSQLQGLRPAAIPSNLPASTRDRLAQIDKQFKAQFEADAQKTIAQYQATKADLDAQYSALQSGDSVATGAAAKQVRDLQHQRDDLYNRIVGQIESDAKSQAAKHGLQVVFVNISAASGGIDLTDDVEKDIESLHQ